MRAVALCRIDDWTLERYETMLSRICRAAAGLCLVLAAPAPAQTISGGGAKQCGDFIQAVTLKSDVAINGFISWAQGYLSAYNATNPEGRDVAVDPSGLQYWLTDHCSKNREESFFRAVQQLAAELGR